MDLEEFLSDSDNEIEQLVTIYASEEYSELCKKTPRPQRISKLTGHECMVEVLNGHPMTCYQLFQMEPSCFIQFCEELKRVGKIKASKFISIQEQVAIFLFIIAQKTSGYWRSISTFYRNNLQIF